MSLLESNKSEGRWRLPEGMIAVPIGASSFVRANSFGSCSTSSGNVSQTEKELDTPLF